jgi:hypothetical protein
MKEEPRSTTELWEREGQTVRKSISSPWESHPIVSPQSVMERRGLWILDITKRPGQGTGGPTPSSYPNKINKTMRDPSGFLTIPDGFTFF